jgi:hypothetical protein
MAIVCHVGVHRRFVPPKRDADLMQHTGGSKAWETTLSTTCIHAKMQSIGRVRGKLKLSDNTVEPHRQPLNFRAVVS